MYQARPFPCGRQVDVFPIIAHVNMPQLKRTRTKRDVMLSFGHLPFGFDYASDGESTAQFLRSTLRNIAQQYESENLRPLNINELSTTVTNLIGTLLCSHSEKNNMLDWTRSGLYLAQRDFLAYKKNPFVNMILNMKLPTFDDVKKCNVGWEWNSWNIDDNSSNTAFYEKAGRLFGLMEKSLKMYWVAASTSGGGKHPFVQLPARYTDGTSQPFLLRMEKLERKLQIPEAPRDNYLEIELRLKLIIRRFLRHKMRLIVLNNKIKQIFTEWAAAAYLKTAKSSTGHLMSA